MQLQSFFQTLHAAVTNAQLQQARPLQQALLINAAAERAAR
jgi:hypothetical protein